uniref:Uncharacterized protein n=1 Tax=Coturnix japonica TaxID=93934 RepID=A0A8C2ST51_COTJA
MASLQVETEKLTIVGMKFSLMMMERICFQSVVLSPRSRQMDSSASFTAAGGLAIERTSTRCCFFMDFTANQYQNDDRLDHLWTRTRPSSLLSLCTGSSALENVP